MIKKKYSKEVKSYRDFLFWKIENQKLTDVYFDLIYDCNQNCAHCYVARNNKRRLLSTEKVKKILDELARFNVSRICFSGGEIFLRDDIFEILDYAAKLKFELCLKTNGTLINDDIARRLSKDAFLSQVQISLLGGKEKTHDSLTRSPGSFKKVLNAIKSLMSYLPKEKVSINFVPLNKNYKEVRLVQNLARRYGCMLKSQLTYVSCSWHGASTLPESYRLSVMQKYEYLNIVGLPRSSSLIHKNPIKIDRKLICTGDVTSMYIDPFGFAHPCSDLRDINFGSVVDLGISKVWKNGAKFNIKKEGFSKCFKCHLIDYCDICPAMNYIENKSFYKPSKEICDTALATKMYIDNRTVKKQNHILIKSRN